MIVYTVITNQKDTLQPVPEDSNAEYICFSDRPFKHHQWQYRPIEALGLNDPRRIARRYKILSHIYFPDQTTIWIDGRIRLNVTPTELVKRYTGDICMRPHPSRNCIYKEAAEVKRIGYEEPEIVDRQMARYRELGYPENLGLYETGLLIRRNTIELADFNNAWWAEVSSGSKRDQLSVNFVEWYYAPIVELIDRSVCRVMKHQKVTNVNT